MARQFLIGYQNDDGSPGSPIYSDKPEGSYDPFTFEVGGKTYVAKPDYQDPTMADGLQRGYGIDASNLVVDPETGQTGLLQDQQTRLDGLMTSRQSEDFIGSLGPFAVLMPVAFAVAGNYAFAGEAAAPATGATAGVAGTDFGATIPYSAGSTASFSAAQQAAGLSAAQAAGAEVGATSFTAAQQAAALSAAGGAVGATAGGLINAGAPAAAPAAETGGAAATTAEAAPVMTTEQQAAMQTANEWTGANFADTAMEASPGVTQDVASTIDATAATPGGTAPLTQPDAAPSATSQAAQKIAGTGLSPEELKAANDLSVPSLEAAASNVGASAAPLGELGGPKAVPSLLDKVWAGFTSPQGIASAITTVGGAIGGMGTAALNKSTMQDKAALDLSNAEALQNFRVNQSRQNMYTGLIGVRPAAVRAPLQRLSGGAVYGPTGLIRRA